MLSLALIIFMVLLYCKIFGKAGYSWAMGLLVLIPGIGNLLVLLILAFGQWPIHRELDAYQQGRQSPQPPQSPSPSTQG